MLHYRATTSVVRLRQRKLLCGSEVIYEQYRRAPTGDQSVGKFDLCACNGA